MSLVYTNQPGKRRPFCLYKTVTYEGRTAQSRKLDTDDDDDDKKNPSAFYDSEPSGPSNKSTRIVVFLSSAAILEQYSLFSPVYIRFFLFRVFLLLPVA